MANIIINCKTREVARKLAKENQGRVIDNGTKSLQRWQVVYETKEVLKLSTKVKKRQPILMFSAKALEHNKRADTLMPATVEVRVKKRRLINA